MPDEKGDHKERLHNLRDRLYSRGAPPPPEPARHELTDMPVEVPHSWRPERFQAPPRVDTASANAPSPLLAMKQTKRSYRTTLIVAGLVFFVVALALSGSFLFFGKNMISGDNITIEIPNPPFAVGGGEELPFEVVISNQNAVPIESATLIIEYPFGTQSAGEEGKELFRERKPLALMNPGEVVKIPLRARVFGEENEEKTVLVSIEYRVQGSNATFFKEAPPLRFKISSSPVVLSVENVTKSASGQEVELKVVVSSNSPSEISDLLVKAEYPFGFDYTDSTPGPVSGRDTWNVSNLKPEEKKTITLRGILVGKQDEIQIFKFSVGVPNERDRLSLASVFTTQTEEITIEQPFLDLAILVDGREGGESVVSPGEVTTISVMMTNNLSSTLYDSRISVDLSGNAIDKSQIASKGFYDSATNVITWDAQSTKELKTITPGESATVMFVLTPLQEGLAARTPQISFTVHAEGSRVSENQVSQRLTGTATKVIKVESVAQLSSRALYSIGAFTNTGPVPLQAEQVTTLTMSFAIKNGTNAVTDGTVTATLPQYATWLNLTTSGPQFSYNPQAREVTWKVGDLRADEERKADFQVSVRPSAGQVGQTITLLNTQRFRATDRFTQTVIRTEAPALTSRLIADPAHDEESGSVEGQ